MNLAIKLTLITLCVSPLITYTMPAPPLGLSEKKSRQQVTRIDPNKIIKIVHFIVQNEEKYSVEFKDCSSITFSRILSGIFKDEIYRSDYFFPLKASLKEDFELIKELARPRSPRVVMIPSHSKFFNN